LNLIAVTNNMYAVHDLATKIIQVHDLVDSIHIREKAKCSSELLTLLNLLRDNGVPMNKITMNNRLDVALLTNLINIHLPTHGLPVKLVKEQYPTMSVGRSVHSVAEAIQAEKDQANYVIYGHCFETNCKKGLSPNGIDPLIEIKKALTIPVYAIGGITPDRLPIIKDCQIDGIAVMSGIFSSENPRDSALKYVERCTSNL
jgi:thiazole tautomerase (transcriptional regulator TenI)